MGNLSNLERQHKILDLIQREGRVSIPQLCQAFQVSQATARRDLETLSDRGKIRRFHGGALTIEAAPPELPLSERSAEQAAEKRQIGQAAVSLVQNGQTILLGSGTTVLELARCLGGHDHLTVITNSLQAANVLAGFSGLTLILLGGVFRSSELSFIGHLTEQALAEVRADLVFMGVRAIDLEAGLTNDYLPETLTDRAILQAGRQVVLLADHTKLGRIAPAYLAPLDAIHVLVTDEGAAQEFTRPLERQGVRVLRAGK